MGDGAVGTAILCRPPNGSLPGPALPPTLASFGGEKKPRTSQVCALFSPRRVLRTAAFRKAKGPSRFSETERRVGVGRGGIRSHLVGKAPGCPGVAPGRPPSAQLDPGSLGRVPRARPGRARQGEEGCLCVSSLGPGCSGLGKVGGAHTAGRAPGLGPPVKPCCARSRPKFALHSSFLDAGLRVRPRHPHS